MFGTLSAGCSGSGACIRMSLILLIIAPRESVSGVKYSIPPICLCSQRLSGSRVILMLPSEDGEALAPMTESLAYLMLIAAVMRGFEFGKKRQRALRW